MVTRCVSCFLLAAGVIALASQKPIQDVKADQLPVKGMSVTVAGVAKIDNGKVTCWSINGSRNARLEEELQLTIDIRAKNRQQIDWSRNGKKCRIVVLRSSGNRGSSSPLKPSTSNSFEVIADFNVLDLGAHSRVSVSSPTPMLHAYVITTEEKADKTSLIFTETVVQDQPKKLGLKVGNECKIGSLTAKIRSIEPFDLQAHNKHLDYDELHTKHWLVTIDALRTTNESFLAFNWSAFKGDLEDMWVESKGQKVPKDKMSKILEAYSQGRSLNELSKQGIFQMSCYEMRLTNPTISKTEPSFRTLVTNFEPKPWDTLMVTANGPKSIRITDIPLF